MSRGPRPRSSGSVGRGELGALVEATLEFGERLRAQPEHCADHASALVGFELSAVGRRAVERHADLAALRLVAAAAQLLDPRTQLLGFADAVRQPLVAVGEYAVDHALAVAADEDRRMRLLDRLRPGPDSVEVNVAAVVGRLLLCPDRLHRLHALSQQAESRRRIRAVVAHLLDVPASADAEQEAPAGEEVQCRDLLRGRDRIALDDEADPGRNA